MWPEVPLLSLVAREKPHFSAWHFFFTLSGVPLPPTRLEVTDCYNRRTNLSWTPVISNSAKITTHYLIEQETNHEPNVFKIVYNITSPDITSVSLTLPGWSSLRFRVRTANDAGASRPSETTERRLCITPVGGRDFFCICCGSILSLVQIFFPFVSN